jgi:thiamine pyrophosphokinase
MNKIGIIISGGAIEAPFALEFLKKKTAGIMIAVDRGLEFMYKYAVEPTHIVGDFDSIDPAVISYYKSEAKVPIREFNPVKDASDTEIAIRLAIELGVNELWIIGGTGTRLDHVLANIQSLKIAANANVKAYLLDSHNCISLLEKSVSLCKKEAFGPYFSLFPLGGRVEGLTIRGAKYPLVNHTLEPYDSLSVSNQFADDEVFIEFNKGTIILMETRD